ncbi:2-oxo acid dehydrogenase subunit E2 [Rhodosalinus halophilus]|uniref:Dihydrolipoamide acetyltransferase component of pyruvate dehydrogenase complex n=1 Tax=Rhodosalinus halophilus TaxID=2259333 RepID=A0A365UD04_9RHOB|nr:dihydrolipoamide acetyltransferase family protein [Rhodosalinus halophilus]RBI87201.1 2-oxo acid dehydrogenase subunit E2 [Rhodosalinus halophilus]
MGVFAMPSLGSDMEAATLAEWLVRPGDRVRRGDVVAVVETQKGAIEIETYESGTVAELTAEPGQTLPVGTPMAVIRTDGAAEAGATPPVETTPRPEPEAPPVAARPGPVSAGQLRASPAARVRAGELGLDLAGLAGSGPGGAVVLADVEAAAARGAQPSAPAPQVEMRKAIAAAMTRAKRTIPHFYLSETFDLQPATDWLAERNAARPPEARLLMAALFVRAAALAAARVPALNGHFTDGAFHPAPVVNAGLAVALRGGGLVAPALGDAAALDLDQTMAGMRDLVARARAGRLRGSEITAGTITVSALGERGAEAMTGVIFPPQVALVCLGAPKLRPWVVEGAIRPRQVATVTVSADHRVSDGRQVARFIEIFADALAHPERL